MDQVQDWLQESSNPARNLLEDSRLSRQAKPHSPVTTQTLDWFVYLSCYLSDLDFRKNLPSDDMIMIKSFAQLKKSAKR